MKTRAVSSLLASLAVVSFILPAVAAPLDDQQAGSTPSIDPSSIVATVEAASQSAIRLDGVPQQSVEYQIRNGVTYITVRSFVSMLDPAATVEEANGVVTVSSARVEQVVDAAGNTANVVQETLNMTVSAGTPYIVANGRYLYAKDGIITLSNSIAAPVRVLARVFNLDVGYNGSVLLSRRSASEGVYIQSGDSSYNADTLYWLSRIINAESGNQVLNGKIAVGNVVMNRVKSPLFPNNIYDVLYQKNQFSPAINGTLNRTPNAESVIAAKLVMDGADLLPNALFFAQAGLSCYASKNRPYITTIGAHAFYA